MIHAVLVLGFPVLGALAVAGVIYSVGYGRGHRAAMRAMGSLGESLRPLLRREEQ